MRFRFRGLGVWVSGSGCTWFPLCLRGFRFASGCALLLPVAGAGVEGARVWAHGLGFRLYGFDMQGVGCRVKGFGVRLTALTERDEEERESERAKQKGSDRARG